MKKVLVTGATGPLGAAIIATLLKEFSAHDIHVLSRYEQKVAELKRNGLNAYLGNYNDVKSLEAAMFGADAVLLISSSDHGDRMQQHRNVVDAAKKAGVTGIAYTSRSLHDPGSLVNKMMTEHFKTEDYIKESGMSYIIFRNALYMDTIPQFVDKKVFETGEFILPAGAGKVAYALRQEQGEAIAWVLLNENFDNKIYRFTGSGAYSFDDVAGALTELSGRPIKYNPVEMPAYEAMMLKAGVPEAVVKMMAGFNADIKNSQEADITNELENKLGRKPASLKEGLKTLYNL